MRQTRTTTAAATAAAIAVIGAAALGGEATGADADRVPGLGPAPIVAAPRQDERRPNVIVVMTDDQTVGDLAAMPRTRALLGGAGVTFDRSYSSYPVCAPSRATFLSGQYAHNNGVMGIYRPTGGYSRFDAANALPVWLQDAGYDTIHLGKYVNGYGTDVPATQPPGWSEWYGAIDPTTYRMWGYSLNENGTVRTYGSPRDEDPRLYQTDVLAGHALRAIERRAGEARPFFMSLAFLAPHHESAALRQATGRVVRAAPRHAGARAAGSAPATPAYDEADVSDKPRFIRRRHRLAPEEAVAIDRRRHERRRSLLSVDEAVEQLVATLRRTGQLERTYILFTSDNGYLQGEHRVPAGKVLPYEAAARVPLLIRGPGLAAGARTRALVSNIDLAPTILELARAAPGRRLDGRSLLPFARDPRKRATRPLLLESGRPAYRAVRTDRWLYVRYGSGERELYDLHRDPHELRSLHADPRLVRTRAKLSATLRRLAGGGR
ncbi:sulfatase [Conexibacter stalactiti]|uniref:Sulfatase n=1 Tax=Conexibacter stalactiti TaxID=1940611 RepID=A0ABU4HY08_9ACTN|nr:sulfatase [Conexibacter stalactiti]MDW5596944.1 sulfatase [Conexibacter stalactiti]MEC5037586.1 sulfatase [Conexibacter stalactiti]